LFTEERWTKGGKKGCKNPAPTGYNNIAFGAILLMNEEFGAENDKS